MPTLDELRLKRDSLRSKVADKGRQVEQLYHNVMTEQSQFPPFDADTATISRRVRHMVRAIPVEEKRRHLSTFAAIDSSRGAAACRSNAEWHRGLILIFREMAGTAQRNVRSAQWKHAIEDKVRASFTERTKRCQVDGERPVAASWDRDNGLQAAVATSRELHNEIIATHRKGLAASHRRLLVKQRMSTLRYLTLLLTKSSKKTVSENARCLVECQNIAACVGEMLSQSKVTVDSARSDRLVLAGMLRQYREKLQQAASEHAELKHKRMRRAMTESHLYRLEALQQILLLAIAEERAATFIFIDAITNVYRRILDAQESSDKLMTRALELRIELKRKEFKSAYLQTEATGKDKSGGYRFERRQTYATHRLELQFARKRARVAALWNELGKTRKEVVVPFIFRALDVGPHVANVIQAIASEVHRLVASNEFVRLFHSNTADVGMVNSCYHQINELAVKDGGVSSDALSLLHALALGVRQRIIATETRMTSALTVHDIAVQTIHDMLAQNNAQRIF